MEMETETDTAVSLKGLAAALTFQVKLEPIQERSLVEQVLKNNHACRGLLALKHPRQSQSAMRKTTGKTTRRERFDMRCDGIDTWGNRCGSESGIR